MSDETMEKRLRERAKKLQRYFDAPSAIRMRSLDERIIAEVLHQVVNIALEEAATELNARAMRLWEQANMSLGEFKLSRASTANALDVAAASIRSLKTPGE